MKKASHPWPTDGVTKKRLDQVTDRIDRKIDRWEKRLQRLEMLVQEWIADVTRLKQGRIIYEGPSDDPDLQIPIRRIREDRRS